MLFSDHFNNGAGRDSDDEKAEQEKDKRSYAKPGISSMYSWSPIKFVICKIVLTFDKGKNVKSCSMFFQSGTLIALLAAYV